MKNPSLRKAHLQISSYSLSGLKQTIGKYIKVDLSPECVCEVLAQNTQQIIFYSLLNLPRLGYEPKRAVFEYVALMQMSCCSRRRGQELQELKLWQ